MTQPAPITALQDSVSPAQDVPADGGDGTVTSSLAELIVEFDLSPYLGGPLREAWDLLVAYPLLLAVVLIAIGYGIGRVLKWVIHVLLDRLRKSTKSEFDYEIAHYLTSPVFQTTVTFFIVLALATLELPGALEQFFIKICITLLLIFWGRAWFRATRVILQALEADKNRFQVFQGRTVPLYEMGIKLLLAAIFFYLFFLVWGIDATAWVASAGIIGIAVGFAARDTIANLISGVSIVADAPYKIGDYIVLDTGERGVVTNLGIRSTRLMTRDDVEVSIPNAVIGTAKIINESGGPFIRHRIRVPVGVAYDSDIDKVIDTLKEIAAENKYIVDDPAARVRIRGFGDNAINLELLGWIKRPADRGLTVHRLNYKIIKRFREENIEIPFPQRDLHFRNAASDGSALPVAKPEPAAQTVD
jgi:small-conductance mechanosensitive channel